MSRFLEREPGDAAAAPPAVARPVQPARVPVVPMLDRLATLPAPQRSGALAGMQRGCGNAAVTRLLHGPSPHPVAVARQGQRCKCASIAGPDGQCDTCRDQRAASREPAAADAAIARMLAARVEARLQRKETGAGLDDPLYMEDREWSSGQGPDDRVTGTRLQNWAIARGSQVVGEDGALMRMQVEDGAEPAIVVQIFLLLTDLLRGATPGRTSHFQVEGERTHPYPVAEGKPSRLDKFKGSPNARERAVMELHDSWRPIEVYLTHALSRRFNTALLDAFGRTPKRDMELETRSADILQLRKRAYKDVYTKGYAPFGGMNVWKVGDRVGTWKVEGISDEQSSFWAVLDKHPRWFYKGSLSMLGSQDVFVQKVAAGVADQAKFAGMLWPMMIKGAGFAMSFSPVPAVMIAGAVFEAFGDEGVRELTGEGKSFKDVSGETARQILVDLALNRLFGGAGKATGSGTDAARALERAVEASASRVRQAVKEGVEKSEGRSVVAALHAGQGRRVADPKLRGEGFLDEVTIRHDGGEHTFRRKGDGSWCRWSEMRLCDLNIPTAEKILGPPRTGRITSDQHPKFKDETVYDVKKASARAEDMAEVRMAELWERNGSEVHWNANDSHGDFLIDGVPTDTKLLTQKNSISGAVKRASGQGKAVIIDGTVVKLTREDTERLVQEFLAQAARHPGPYRNIDTIYIVEHDLTIYVHKRDTALHMKDPDKPNIRQAGDDE